MKKKNEKPLSAKEKLFCTLYIRTRNEREAAYRSGYKLFPEKTGLKLLAREEIARFIKKESKKQDENSSYENLAATGLKRIAFSGISDAVKLLYSEEINPDDLDGLDLFMVSEIKKPKTGGLEIKFFDRIKALERLSELKSGMSDSEVSPFYNALVQGAEAIKEKEEGNL